MFKLDETITFQNKGNDILAAGELLVDMISNDYDNSDEQLSFRPFFGGSPSNIAMNVNALGVHSFIASAVGEDRLGNFLIDHLDHARMCTDYIQKVNHSTSLVLVNKSQGSPVPIFYRGADYHLRYTPDLEKALLNSKILHFSCWPVSKEPSRQTIETMIIRAKENNIIVGFDPNYHPMIWQENEQGEEYVKAIVSQVDIVKPSEDDAERLFGQDTHENQVRKFLELGAKLVIMTLGKDGALVSNGKETVKFTTLANEVVDTTGAGDAFWSGFYTGLIKNLTIREALSLGFAVSAYKLKYTGAVVDLPKMDVIRNMYNQ